MVWEGMENIKFKKMFNIWKDRDEIEEISIRDGHKAGEVIKVEEEMDRMNN
jgi:hypothetical protein